jgi:Zn finger protein HypA/HybF involved in hydrogenase expression
MENKIYKLHDQEFIDLVKSSLNISEVLFKLGYTTKGNSWGYSQVKQRMTDLNLAGKDFRGRSAIAETVKKVNPENLFCKGSKHNRSVLRRTIIQQQLLPYKCAICGITEWQGKTLSLELDHINGENNDNRIENLRFLCPNCHSQTDTYGSRNQKITESKYDITDELRDLVISKYLELKSQKKVSEILNIKHLVVKQIISEAGLGKSNQKYVIQYDKDMNEVQRFGTISECCDYLMANNLVTTKIMKTCRTTLLRNVDKFWNNYYFKLLDA